MTCRVLIIPQSKDIEPDNKILITILAITITFDAPSTDPPTASKASAAPPNWIYGLNYFSLAVSRSIKSYSSSMKK